MRGNEATGRAGKRVQTNPRDRYEMKNSLHFPLHAHTIKERTEVGENGTKGSSQKGLQRPESQVKGGGRERGRGG